MMTKFSHGETQELKVGETKKQAASKKNYSGGQKIYGAFRKSKAVQGGKKSQQKIPKTRVNEENDSSLERGGMHIPSPGPDTQQPAPG